MIPKLVQEVADHVIVGGQRNLAGRCRIRTAGTGRRPAGVDVELHQDTESLGAALHGLVDLLPDGDPAFGHHLGPAVVGDLDLLIELFPQDSLQVPGAARTTPRVARLAALELAMGGRPAVADRGGGWGSGGNRSPADHLPGLG